MGLGVQRPAERGFTLVEMVVAVAIIAILAFAAGVWMLGMHPGALRQAVDDFDSALATAHGVAETSGNGATIAVVPLTNPQGSPIPGYQLRVYSGRPNAANAVTQVSVLPVISEALIAEKTFGKPPFAIFLNSAGYPVGTASYPSVASNGTITFPVIAKQPNCPAGGIQLTFTSPSSNKNNPATDTRVLKCNSAIPAGGLTTPDPSPTPNAPTLSTGLLKFDWPGDSVKSFTAQEFGYQQWFAISGSTSPSCVNSTIAAMAPGWPYSTPPPSGQSVLSATPQPYDPTNIPYSWPYSTQSMNDAPALFNVEPVSSGDGGSCAFPVTDAHNQWLAMNVSVMGWLKGASSADGKTYSNQPGNANGATITAQFKNVGDSETVTFTKPYDSAQYFLDVQNPSNAAQCASYVSFQPGSATAASGNTPATYPVAFAAIAVPAAPIDCTWTFGSHTAEPRITVTLHLIPTTGALDPPWPPAVQYPLPGKALGTVAYVNEPPNVAMWLNRLMGGGVAVAAGPLGACNAGQPRAFDGKGWSAANALILQHDPYNAGLSTDKNGCLMGPSGASIAIHEANYTGAFADAAPPTGGCGFSVRPGPWIPSASGPLAAQAFTGQQPTPQCTLAFKDESSQPNTVTAHAQVTSSGPCGTKAICALLYEASYEGSYYDNVNCKTGIDTCIRFVKGFVVTVSTSTDGGTTWAQTHGCTDGTAGDLCGYYDRTTHIMAVPTSAFPNGQPDYVEYEDTFTPSATLEIYTNPCGSMSVYPAGATAPPPDPTWTNIHACVNV